MLPCVSTKRGTLSPVFIVFDIDRRLVWTELSKTKIIDAKGIEASLLSFRLYVI